MVLIVEYGSKFVVIPLFAYIDGQPVVQARDSSFSDGGIGFRSWDNSSACFDDLTVRSP